MSYLYMIARGLGAQTKGNSTQDFFPESYQRASGSYFTPPMQSGANHTFSWLEARLSNEWEGAWSNVVQPYLQLAVLLMARLDRIMLLLSSYTDDSFSLAGREIDDGGGEKLNLASTMTAGRIEQHGWRTSHRLGERAWRTSNASQQARPPMVKLHWEGRRNQALGALIAPWHFYAEWAEGRDPTDRGEHGTAFLNLFP
jgi:hypothetical protein